MFDTPWLMIGVAIDPLPPTAQGVDRARTVVFALKSKAIGGGTGGTDAIIPPSTERIRSMGNLSRAQS